MQRLQNLSKLYPESSTQSQSGLKYASQKENAKFREDFPDIPQDEQLVVGVRATPETAEDLTQSISAGGKSKDIFNSVKNKENTLLICRRKIQREKAQRKPPACTKPPHSHFTWDHMGLHGHPQASDEGNQLWSGKHKKMMREMNDK
ncbi:hypothetical protein L218DRAFT_949433 [Marasmius fiardii PR-910]|nr:hypothetical protein L218DRAFT_949433 [Marasmius fiardii PR-910]